MNPISGNENFIRIANMVIFLCLLAVLPSSAATHIVEFSGSAGSAYSPNQLSVHVGDTVIWKGLFSAYPMRSTFVPPGAARLDVATGVEHVYKVKVPGTYRFQCDDYTYKGMKGSFTASDKPVKPLPDHFAVSPSLHLNGVIRNPIQYPGEVIGFTIKEEQRITLRLLTLEGREVATLFNGIMGVGTHWVRLPNGNIPPGEYICELNGYQTDVMHLVFSKKARRPDKEK
jgi:plastocyanin